MAPDREAQGGHNESKNRLPGSMKKLRQIPKGSRIQKRPLTRRQQPASSKSRIIYVSSKTPFMSAVKRVQKCLDKGLRTATAAPRNASLASRIAALQDASDEKQVSGGDTTVTLMGTGKAIERTLGVASWFEQQGDCDVQLRTRTVATVDDVVVDDDADGEEESRVRRMSCLEVSVKMK